MNTPAIEASGLSRSFGETAALTGVDLEVRSGSVYGLLGPNGAGKTTTVRILATLLRPGAGSARVLGFDVVSESDEVRRRISLTGQFASVDNDLTADENLVMLGQLLGMTRAQAARRSRELLAAFGLDEARNRLVRTFSGGMRRRLDIAASTVLTPELLFLDEPTTGLDPRSRYQVWQTVRDLVSSGTTVLLTTQYLDEADQLADRIAVIDHGKVIAEGTPGELKARLGSGTLRVRLIDPGQRAAAEGLLSGVLETPVDRNADPATLVARVDDPTRVTRALDGLSRAGIGVTDFALGQPSLDEVFLSLTGRRTDENRTDEKEAVA